MRLAESLLPSTHCIFRCSMAKKKQKFQLGDIVRVAKDLGPQMTHFSGKGEMALVIGSYSDQYGGEDVDSYTLYFQRGGECSWYLEHQLSLIEKRRNPTLQEMKHAFDRRPDEEARRWAR